MLDDTSGLVFDLDKLRALPYEEHAQEIAKICTAVGPVFENFQGRTNFEGPEDEELRRRADFAQLSPRKLKEAIVAHLGDPSLM